MTYPIQFGEKTIACGAVYVLGFMSEGIMEHKIDRWIGVAAPVFVSVCHGKGAELKNKTLDLPVSRHFCHHPG